MPKYLLLKHYTGGPERHPDFVPFLVVTHRDHGPRVWHPPGTTHRDPGDTAVSRTDSD
jgi:hypothetical protein